MKGFWSYVSSLNRSKGYPSSMTYCDRVTDDPKHICQMFSDFFQSTFEPTIPHLDNEIENIETSCDNLHSNVHIPHLSFDVAEVFKILKSLDINKGPGPDKIEPLFFYNCADTICVPLTLLFNKCMTDGIFPTSWKMAHITPVHKGGSKHNIDNYRPISILSTIPKVLEKLVHSHIYPILHSHIITEQHGFVRGRSTTTNLLLYSQYLFESLDSGQQIDSIYTDFKKAFDKVDHLILIRKLAFNGIKGNLLRWFISYLSNRQQAVKMNGLISSYAPMTSGVPQGSILGPFLFILFINDIASCFKHTKFLLYADDLKLFATVSNTSDCINMQSDLNRLHNYCQMNKLHLSYSKCQYISFTRKKSRLIFEYGVGGNILESVSRVRDLGILFDSKLHFNLHIEQIVSKAYRMLGFVLRTAKMFKNTKTYLILYKSLVRSQLEYAVVVWNPLYRVYSDNIESIQKRFLATLQHRLGVSKSAYKILLDTFGCENLVDRRTVLESMILFNICQGKYDCPDLLRQVIFRTPERITRSSALFQVKNARTNAGIRAPLRRLCDVYNKTMVTLDIFHGLTL